MLRFALVLVPALWFLPSPQDPAVPAGVLARAQTLARTGEAHQRLQQLAGTWDVEVRTPEAGGAREERGTPVGKGILGGRYMVLNYQLVLRGRPLEAVQILGFDNLRQLYTASWRDDLSTWSVECQGTPDPAAPARLSLRGELTDAQDPSGRPFRLEFDLATAGLVHVRLHEERDGKPVLVQQQHWTARR
ncbi:MAG: DUF1579 domain-containing protein [Planctomycetes bacterium]|nr:DUF1579 domain-containing protein [Planctomycetota bacterium]